MNTEEACGERIVVCSDAGLWVIPHHLWRGEYKATDEFMPSAQRSVLYVDDQLSIDDAAVGQSFEWMDWPWFA